jgi:hypothetical protein
MKLRIQCLLLIILFCCLIACGKKETQNQNIDVISNPKSALNYLKNLKGKWKVNDTIDGDFGWEFDVTSRGNVVIERLKLGTETEMLTIYNIDNGMLYGNHFCQLQNQPRLIAVNSEIDGDLHFLCNENVGNTISHKELHMHGVHFKKNDDKVVIWMDMFKGDSLAFETRYELSRDEITKTDN